MTDQLAEYGAEIDRLIADTPTATVAWWDEVHRLQYLKECILWVSEQLLFDGKVRNAPRWSQYIWDHAGAEPFMQGVSRDEHDEAFKDLISPQLLA